MGRRDTRGGGPSTKLVHHLISFLAVMLHNRSNPVPCMPTVVTPFAPQTPVAVGVMLAMTPSPLGAAAASMANGSTAVLAAKHGRAQTAATVGMPMVMKPFAPSGAAAGSTAKESSVPLVAEHSANSAIHPTLAPKPTMPTSPVTAASVASLTRIPAPTSASAQKHHQEVPSPQHNRKHNLTFCGNLHRQIVLPDEFLPLRKKDVTEDFCEKRFDYAPYIVLCSGGQVIFRTNNVENLPKNKATIHKYRQTLLALHGQIQQMGNQFYEKLIVESFQSSGLVKAGGFHSPQTYQDVLNILRSAIVAAKAKHNLGWLVVFIAEHFWSVMDDMKNEK